MVISHANGRAHHATTIDRSLSADASAATYVVRGAAIIDAIPGLAAELASVRAGAPPTVVDRHMRTLLQSLLDASPINAAQAEQLAASVVIVPSSEAASRIRLGLAIAIRLSGAGCLRVLSGIKIDESQPLSKVVPLKRTGAPWYAVALANAAATHVIHEAGHVWELGDPHVARVARQFVGSIAINDRTATLNDLYVVSRFADSLHNPGAQRILLEHAFSQPSVFPRALTDEPSLVAAFAGVATSLGIDIGKAARDFMALTPPYGMGLRPFTDNRAFPVVGNFYSGTVYATEGGTEIISLGLEAFCSPEAMRALLVSAPDHFAFMVGLVSSCALRPRTVAA